MGPPLPLLRYPDAPGIVTSQTQDVIAEMEVTSPNEKTFCAPSMFSSKINCPPFVDLGFISISHRGPNDESEYGQLMAVANDIAGLSEEEHTVVMEYLGGFFESNDALPGFVASFDLRNLQSMPMSVFRKFAEWACERERKERLERLAVEVNLIVP